MTHEQMMEKAWRFIKEFGITEDREEFENNPEGYLVKDIYEVRYAFYNDIESGKEDNSLEEFFDRYGIKFES